MDIKDFVTSSLRQLVEAVEETQLSLLEKDSTAEINPNDVEGVRRSVHEVDFDIAITVTDEGEMKAGGKLKILSLGVDGAVSKANQNEHVHQLKFTIPVALPFSKLTANQVQRLKKERAEARHKQLQQSRYNPLDAGRV